MDFDEDFDCDVDTIDEALLAEAEGYASTLREMSIRISNVATLNDCQAIAAGEFFVANDPLVTFEPDEIATTVIQRHQPGTIAIVIGTP